VRPTKELQKRVEQARRKVRQMARRYARRWPSVEEEELIGVGDHAVAEILDGFDASRGKELDAYVFKRIRGAMHDHARKVLGDAMMEAERIDHVDVDDDDDMDDDSSRFVAASAPTERDFVASGLKRRAVASLAALRASSDASGEDELISRIDRARQVRSLHLAVDELDEPMRRFVRVRFFDGATLEAAAAAVGRTKRTGQRLEIRATEWLFAWFRGEARRARKRSR
jgi:RNA polymerase sigma factor (sigma-70 family)